jgi:hypothetical protein
MHDEYILSKHVKSLIVLWLIDEYITMFCNIDGVLMLW